MTQPDNAILSSIWQRMSNLPGFATCRPLGPRSRGTFGETPLHIAAIWGDEEAVAALLNAGADINAEGEDKHTPLHEAVEQGHVGVIKLLLARGASLDRRDADNLTASELAALLGNTAVIDAFIER